MYRAYDTMLQVSVSAHEAARNGDEYYRYECLCCGEEVYIAAAYSHYQSTHFRHRRGNNNKRCEKYMGQIGVHSSSIHRRKSCFERADFVFNPKLQTLNVFICLDDHELDYYAGQDATFECRTGYSSSPIIALKINRMNFAAQKSVLLPIDVFSNIYYLSASTDATRYGKYISSSVAHPLFFRETEIDDGAIAKSVHSGLIYTDAEYYVLFHGEDQAVSFCNHVGVEPIETIRNAKTAGKTFWIAHVVIRELDPSLRNWLSGYGYFLIQSEKALVLWPPAVIENSTYLLPPGAVYLSTSFQLQAHANVSLPSTCVKSFPEGQIAKITVSDRAKIYKNGVEIVINASQKDNELQPKQNIYILECNKFTIPSGGKFFLSNMDGIWALSEGQVLYLTAQSRILHYINGYLAGYIIMPCKPKRSSDETIEDITKFYRVNQEITDRPDSFPNLSEEGQAYIDRSIAMGTINLAVKRYIEEGKI